MSLELIRAPTIDVVSLDEAKAQIPVRSNEYDVYIESLIAAAQNVVATRARQSLTATTWRQRLSCFPTGGEIELYRPPLQSVTSVKYIDPVGVEQTWADSNYEVDTAGKPGRIVRGYGVIWPQIRRAGAASPITIEFVAGYPNAEQVPAEFKAAIKLLVAWWFQQREAMGEGIISKVPFGMETLVASAAHGSYP